ncbi:MAG: hypothetical protein JW727_06315 [Candidatus Aenigmarchaeota archaeon]|nr:hypothetical protein [Candidatus Aenigmarchaeota archaeon]
MFQDFVEELKQLNLPMGEYAIFGSGPLAVRGVRESQDIDLVVKDGLWQELSQKYAPEGRRIYVGNVEIYADWSPWTDTGFLVDSAEIIEGMPYVRLEYVQEWKAYLSRDKDKADLKLIEKYLSEGGR